MVEEAQEAQEAEEAEEAKGAEEAKDAGELITDHRSQMFTPTPLIADS